MLHRFRAFQISKDTKIPSLVPKLDWFCRTSGVCLLVELHRKGSAPAACAAGLFIWKKEKPSSEVSSQNNHFNSWKLLHTLSYFNSLPWSNTCSSNLTVYHKKIFTVLSLNWATVLLLYCAVSVLLYFFDILPFLCYCVTLMLSCFCATMLLWYCAVFCYCAVCGLMHYCAVSLQIYFCDLSVLLYYQVVSEQGLRKQKVAKTQLFQPKVAADLCNYLLHFFGVKENILMHY